MLEYTNARMLLDKERSELELAIASDDLKLKLDTLRVITRRLCEVESAVMVEVDDEVKRDEIIDVLAEGVNSVTYLKYKLEDEAALGAALETVKKATKALGDANENQGR